MLKDAIFNAQYTKLNRILIQDYLEIVCHHFNALERRWTRKILDKKCYMTSASLTCVLGSQWELKASSFSLYI